MQDIATVSIILRTPEMAWAMQLESIVVMVIVIINLVWMGIYISKC